MATQLQLRKGTKIQNDAFTGAEAELTYDSTSKGLRLHDGVKQGGYMVDTVVAWQAPTAENNYTWYRKHSSGWVEQGILNLQDGATFTFPVPMASTNYSVLAVTKVGTGEVKAASIREDQKTTTSCVVYFSSSSYYGYVEVKGMCAQ